MSRSGLTFGSVLSCLALAVSALLAHGCVKTVSATRCDDGSYCPAGFRCVPAPGGGFTCAQSSCGNGIVESGEECDDGEADNTLEPDHCRPNCENPACGDGVTDPGNAEECDDGNGVNTDDCPVTCMNAFCGDGFLRAGVEECDDGNRVLNDDCPDGPGGTCRPSGCGDGIQQTSGLRFEHCDCGDGTVPLPAGCSGPNSNDPNSDCRLDCTISRCGDGTVDTGEECDCGDGSIVPPAGCVGPNSDTAPNACRTTCYSPTCGDGVIDDLNGEECDDGNSINTDDCVNQCENARCGDGHVWTGHEECDDANADNTDACPDDPNGTPPGTCQNWYCGDGHVRTNFEACDDGNTIDGDGCSSNCSSEVCGNGQLNVGETCDDGNQNNNDDCPDNPNSVPPGTCQTAYCGDGFVRSGVEFCDDGNQSNNDDCPDDPNGAPPGTCQQAYCGDGFVWTGFETCDDGNNVVTDACPSGPSGTCQTAACGDGFVWAGNEVCDDNNVVSCDGCRGDCTRFDNICGDGHMECGEACDDNNTQNCDGCRGDCSAVETGCGDGFLCPPEACDDNNTASCDGCRGDCTRVDDICGDGIIECGEACDDNNTNNCDGCRFDCSRPDDVCGDSIQECGEACDDGGTVDCDAGGCRGDCSDVETGCGDGYICPPETCDDGDNDNSDSCPDGPGGTCQQATCGDGHAWTTDGGSEECDTPDLDGQDCTTLPPGYGGTLACYPSGHAQECMFDTALCWECTQHSHCPAGRQCSPARTCEDVGDTCDATPELITGTGTFVFNHTLENLTHQYNGDGCGALSDNTNGPDRVYEIQMTVGDYLVAWGEPNGWDLTMYLSEDPCTASFPNDGGGFCPVGYNRSDWNGGNGNERLDYVASFTGTVYLVVDGDDDWGSYTLTIHIGSGAGLTVASNPGDLIFTEIAPDMDGASCEWFEIHNPGAAPINMLDLRLYDRSNSWFTVNYDLIIRPGEYLVFGRTANETSNCGLEWMSWSNSGFDLDTGGSSSVEIRYDPGGADTTIDLVDYDGGWPYTNDNAMFLCSNHFDASDNNSSANWQEDTTNAYSAGKWGTPSDEPYENDGGNHPNCN